MPTREVIAPIAASGGDISADGNDVDRITLLYGITIPLDYGLDNT
jgi:hypothetical protein